MEEYTNILASTALLIITDIQANSIMYYYGFRANMEYFKRERDLGESGEEVYR